METTTVKLTKFSGSYSGHPATFRRAEAGAFVAISVSAPALTDRYLTEVYVKAADGIETFLGYEPAVCVHPGAMLAAIQAARPTWAEQTHHTACGDL